jgi:putative acetyltransferase
MPRLRRALPADRCRLVEVWLNSVRATHHFLTEADIQALLALVREVALPNLERLLVEHARRLKGALRVSVNEQNPAAIGFYAALGFEVVGRSPVDDAGRPFPLLHMRDAAVASAEPGPSAA